MVDQKNATQDVNQDVNYLMIYKILLSYCKM